MQRYHPAPLMHHRNIGVFDRLLIKHVKSNTDIPAKAGIQWRAKRAGVVYRWIPGQARNDEVHSSYVPDQ
jgi:hypothetical protein